MKTKIQAFVLCSFTLCAGIAPVHNVMAQTSAHATPNHSIAKLTEEQKVNHLIQFVSKMQDATFIRNGSEHSCQEAAEHLESKWEKHRDEVKTARGFVEELASGSGLTGEPYQIRFANGTTKTTNEVLTQELKQLEQL